MYMRKLFVIISFVAFISGFMILSDSCGRKCNHKSSDKMEEIYSRYGEAIDMFSNDSLRQAFSGFIDVLRMIESLPENMSDDEKHLASKAYCNITRILSKRLETNVIVDAARNAYNYQRIADEIDTLTFPMACLLYAATFNPATASDSMIHYTKMAIPFIDTIGEDAAFYSVAQLHLSQAYRHQKKYDSCFRVKRNMIAFSSRRGMDTKGDSLALGVDMFYSPYRSQSKPYLLKVLEIEASDILVGQVMMLLEQIYETENNRDSVLFCRSYYKPSFEAEIERYDDADYFTYIYNRYSTECNDKLDALITKKATRKRISFIIAITVVFAATMTALTVRHIRNKRRYDEHTEQLNNIIESDKFKFSMVDGKIKKMNRELREKKECIKAKDKELDEMKQKMFGKENASDIDAYYKSEICQRIIGKKNSDLSSLTNEDLTLLLQAADKHLDNITARIKNKYPKTNKDDLYYICIILLNTNEYKLQYLLDRNRKTVWYRLNKIKTIMGLENDDDLLMHLMRTFVN